ncbi:hypothetical protein GCM10023329_24360 [Streptomyces sanyensis]|uniref:Uncharacterized protein n=1 Tax=Streptomyces sanyensis TaxID=568869 RepID=A0ABP9A6X9_9ACTN
MPGGGLEQAGGDLLPVPEEAEGVAERLCAAGAEGGHGGHLVTGLTGSESYETPCQQARQSLPRDLLTDRLPPCDAAHR